jgi:hypothetical protein
LTDVSAPPPRSAGLAIVVIVQVDDEAEATVALVLRAAVIHHTPGLDEFVRLLERLQLGAA